MWAAVSGHLEVVKLLIAADAKTDVQSKSGRTALMHAAAAGRLDTVKYLVQSVPNCKVEQQDAEGYTALFFAVKVIIQFR
jgi:uncharacterized protein